MAGKERISSFIQQLYGGNKDRKLSKQDIVSKASSETFSADVEIFFKALPEKSYDEDNLIENLNAIITQRNRVDAVGGKIEM